MTKHYDVLVIGAGSGGVATANRVAAYGRSCAVVETGAIGGTCVNVGCVPKKVMWYGAHLAQLLSDAADYGFEIGTPRLDWKKLVTNRQIYISRLHDIYRRRLDKNKVDYLAGYAQLVSAHEIQIRDQRYSAGDIVIATGGYPRVPDVPGATLGMVSDDFFALPQCPRSMVIVGSGYVATELAGMLAAFGSAVTLVLRTDRLLRSFDRLLQDKLLQALQDQGVNLMPGREVTAIRKNGDNIQVSTSAGDRIETEKLLWAIGRAPNTANLGLELAGVAIDTQGYIKTDVYQNTNVKNIYAIGDVTGRAALTPVAIAAGRRLADRLFGGQPERHLSYELIPTVIFTHPPIGTVGLTEEQARVQFGDTVKIYTREFTSMAHAFTRSKPPTAMKLITQGADEKIIGCHIIGPGADEMLQGFAVAIRMGARKQDFDDTVAIHPTSAEELVTIR